MVRLLVPIINMIMMLFIGALQPSNVSLKMDVPSTVVAGNEFEVRITLDKGDLESFSRFQMDIPAGLTAVSESSANADFSFSDKRVRLIWLRLPNPQEITFAFKVKVDERLKGTFNLDGKFSYIFNNERKTADLDPKSITIEPSPDIDPNLVVDINDFEEKVIQYIPSATENTENIACIRQTPYLNDNRTEYIVNILVSKQDKEKFAKIEESVPEGYNAVALHTNDAIFTFKNQKVKFLWMNLPASSDFYISYRLIPKNGTGFKVPVLNGTFSFMAGDKTISVNILQTNNDIADLNPGQIKSLVAELKSKPQGEITEPQENVKPVIVKEPVSQRSEQVTASKNVSVKIRKGANTYLLQPDSGIYYRIQIAAGHKPIDIKRYFKKFNLDLQVNKENHEGWIKYSIGSFKVYKDARDYRVHIWNTTVIDDAFVAAYNNGDRITVQEALMVADQKWYK